MTDTRTSPDTDTAFRMELQTLINRYSKENGSNTPDFVLANFLCDSLRAFDLATGQRSHWYGLRDCIHRGDL